MISHGRRGTRPRMTIRYLYRVPTGQKKQANGHTKVAQSTSGRSLVFSIILSAVLTAPAAWSGTEPGADSRGPVTNLPMPRYVSMKAAEGNVRRGPSRAHKIDWVFKRRGMPLMITAEHGHWRRVQDRDGAGGW
ncbi:unnamed protein product, partial [Ectocarpus sp. 12 AP-2014]